MDNPRNCGCRVDIPTGLTVSFCNTHRQALGPGAQELAALCDTSSEQPAIVRIHAMKIANRQHLLATDGFGALAIESDATNVPEMPEDGIVAMKPIFDKPSGYPVIVEQLHGFLTQLTVACEKCHGSGCVVCPRCDAETLLCPSCEALAISIGPATVSVRRATKFLRFVTGKCLIFAVGDLKEPVRFFGDKWRLLLSQMHLEKGEPVSFPPLQARAGR